VISSAESGLTRASWARTDDIRAISTTRFTQLVPLGRLSDREVEQVRRWVRRMLA
jgi:mRNA interferase MazF